MADSVRVRVLEARVERHQPNLTIGLRLPLSDADDIRHTTTLKKCVHAHWARPQHFTFACKSTTSADFLELNAYDGDSPELGKKAKFKTVAGCEIHFADWKGLGPQVGWYEIRKRVGKQKYDKKVYGELKVEVTFGVAQQEEQQQRTQLVTSFDLQQQQQQRQQQQQQQQPLHHPGARALGGRHGSQPLAPRHGTALQKEERRTSYGHMPTATQAPFPGRSPGIMPPGLQYRPPGADSNHSVLLPSYNNRAPGVDGGLPLYHTPGPQGPYGVPAYEHSRTPTAGLHTEPAIYNTQSQPFGPYQMPFAHSGSASPYGQMVPVHGQSDPHAHSGVASGGGSSSSSSSDSSSSTSSSSGSDSPKRGHTSAHGSMVACSIPGQLNRWTIPYKDVRLERELGRGSFGTVYLGTWRSSKVAMKMMSENMMSSSQLSDFMKEIALMLELRPHKHIVQVVGIVEQPLAIVMTYLPGGTLEQYLRSPAELRSSRALQILEGVAAGCEHLHAEKIVHRDLAARNILLTDNFEAVVADYGMSRQLSDSPAGKTMSTVGPIKWMAPESIVNREYSFASDCYAWGIVAVEVFTRAEPFPELDNVQAAFAVRDGMRPQIPTHVPASISVLMTNVWDSNPAARPNMSDIASAVGFARQARRS